MDSPDAAATLLLLPAKSVHQTAVQGNTHAPPIGIIKPKVQRYRLWRELLSSAPNITSLQPVQAAAPESEAAQNQQEDTRQPFKRLKLTSSIHQCLAAPNQPREAAIGPVLLVTDADAEQPVDPRLQEQQQSASTVQFMSPAAGFTGGEATTLLSCIRQLLAAASAPAGAAGVPAAAADSSPAVAAAARSAHGGAPCQHQQELNLQQQEGLVSTLQEEDLLTEQLLQKQQQGPTSMLAQQPMPSTEQLDPQVTQQQPWLSSLEQHQLDSSPGDEQQQYCSNLQEQQPGQQDSFTVDEPFLPQQQPGADLDSQEIEQLAEGWGNRRTAVISPRPRDHLATRDFVSVGLSGARGGTTIANPSYANSLLIPFRKWAELCGTGTDLGLLLQESLDPLLLYYQQQVQANKISSRTASRYMGSAHRALDLQQVREAVMCSSCAAGCSSDCLADDSICSEGKQRLGALKRQLFAAGKRFARLYQPRGARAADAASSGVHPAVAFVRGNPTHRPGCECRVCLSVRNKATQGGGDMRGVALLAAAAAADVQQQVLKRPRGRPRKHPILPAVPVAAAAGLHVQQQQQGKRGRGRPRKHPLPPSVASVAAGAAAATSHQQQQPQKRGRGRPRKYPLLPAAAAAAAAPPLAAGAADMQQQPIKRGPGRPIVAATDPAAALAAPAAALAAPCMGSSLFIASRRHSI